MNSTVWKQYDSRWGSKPYPRGSTMSGCGCGCVACTHIIMEQDKYKNITPEPVRQYMVGQGFAIRGKGTTWAGITRTLQHYGYKVVHIGVADPMSKAWTELNKGNRIGIILFSGGRAPNGTVWTGGGHYVAFTDYYVKDGKHYFYTKDSGARNHDSKSHGYYSYERSMRGLVYQMWIVERIGVAKKDTSTSTNKAPASTAPKKSGLTVDGKGGKSTIKATQVYFGVTQDGVITGQKRVNHKYYSSITSVKFGDKGSKTVKQLQKWVGATSTNGVLSQSTVKSWQKKLATLGYYKGKIDGYFGKASMIAWQKFLNDNKGKKAVIPTPTPKPTPTPAPKPTPSPTPTTGAQKILAQARKLSWPKGTAKKKYSYKKGSATSAFKTALKKAYPKRSSWSKAPRVGASCDVAVGVVARTSGVLPKYPRGRSEQRKYKSSKITRIVKTNARPIDYIKPGDIVFYDRNKSGSKGHTFICDVDGIHEAANGKAYLHFNSSKAKLKKRYKRVIILRAK